MKNLAEIGSRMSHAEISSHIRIQVTYPPCMTVIWTVFWGSWAKTLEGNCFWTIFLLRFPSWLHHDSCFIFLQNLMSLAGAHPTLMLWHRGNSAQEQRWGIQTWMQKFWILGQASQFEGLGPDNISWVSGLQERSLAPRPKKKKNSKRKDCALLLSGGWCNRRNHHLWITKRQSTATLLCSVSEGTQEGRCSLSVSGEVYPGNHSSVCCIQGRSDYHALQAITHCTWVCLLFTGYQPFRLWFLVVTMVFVPPKMCQLLMYHPSWWTTLFAPGHALAGCIIFWPCPFCGWVFSRFLPQIEAVW